jgi:SagB-type dehydrogenase family enzyme
MKRIQLISILILSLGMVLCKNGVAQTGGAEKVEQKGITGIILLPAPIYDGGMSVEKALAMRRSIRNFPNDSLLLSDISQILWAAQGITRKKENPASQGNAKYEWQGGLRTAPSAGALYPMELYVVASFINGLAQGVYKYIPKNHSLQRIFAGDKKTAIYDAALKQKAIQEAAALIVMAAVYERTSVKYGERAERYVHMEVGFIGENICLQGVALGIGTVMIGAFHDEELKKVLELPEDESPLAIMPLGKIRKE